MQLKLNSKQNVEENCSDEVESLRCSLKQQRQEFEAFRDNEHLTKMAENRKQVASLVIAVIYRAGRQRDLGCTH